MDTSKYRPHKLTTSSSASGQYRDQLSVEDRQLLDGFGRWLVATGICGADTGSASSYKSGVAAGLVEPDRPLSRNQRSYWKRWYEYLDSLEEADEEQ